jgi:hypothetical protein
MKKPIQRIVSGAMSLLMAATIGLSSAQQVFATEETQTTIVSSEITAVAEAYSVKLESSTNGAIKFDNSTDTEQNFKAGDTVAISLTPDEGYEVNSFTIADAETGDVIQAEESSNDHYEFTMPEGSLSISATFQESTDETVADDHETTEPTDESDNEEAEKTTVTFVVQNKGTATVSDGVDTITLEEGISTIAVLAGTKLTVKADNDQGLDYAVIVTEDENGSRLSKDSDVNKLVKTIEVTDKNMVIAIEFVDGEEGLTMDLNFYGKETLVVGSGVTYGGAGWGTSIFTIQSSGNYAYCGNPALDSPYSGSYEATTDLQSILKYTLPSTLTNYSYYEDCVKAILYFGYGGPGFDKSMWPSLNDRQGKMTKKDYIAYTHIMLAFYVEGNSNNAMYMCNQNFKDWAYATLMGRNATTHDYDPALNGTMYQIIQKRKEVPSATGTVRDDGSIEYFEAFALKTGSNTQYIFSFTGTIDEPTNTDIKFYKRSNNNEITNGNDNYSYEGATYDIYTVAGDKVMTITADDTGYFGKYSLAAGDYTAVETVAPTGYKLDKTPIAFSIVADKTTKVVLKDSPYYGSITINKTYEDDSLVAMQPESYSLKGAVYGVYSDEKCSKKYLIKTMTTDENGVAKVDELPLDTYYVKEITASQGCELDETVYPVEITGTTTKTLDVKITSKEPTTNGSAKIKKVGDATYLKSLVGNNCYSLAGAVYGVYNDESCTDPVMTLDDSGKSVALTLTTDKNGDTEEVKVPEGTYYVKEITASKGFTLDTTVYDVTAVNGETSEIVSEETPTTDPFGLTVIKNDSVIQKSTSQAPTLEGVQFTLKYYDGYYTKDNLPDTPTRTWVLQTKLVDGEYKLSIDDDFKVNGDNFYYDDENRVFLPLGTLTVEETKSVPGYKLSEAIYTIDGIKYKNSDLYLTQITGKEKIAKLSYGYEVDYYNEVERGDVDFSKHEDNGSAMAGIPFKITNVATGESHIVYTDENGYYSSENSYNKHSKNTNANDDSDENSWSSRCGTWFGDGTLGGRADVDNTLGALPYGEYTIEELPCAANKGMTLISQSFYITRENYTVHLGTFDDGKSEPVAVSTIAKDEQSGTHYAQISSAATIIDTVSYEGLDIGESYTLKAILMDKQTGTAITEATKTFTAKMKTGITEMELTFDATTYLGKDVVVFEYLYDSDGLEIATHEDLEDDYQTVHFPQIRTTAIDKETGIHISYADEDITIIDTVEYTDLNTDREYIVNGTLMDKATGKPVRDDAGNTITAKVKFIPETSSGTVDITFKFSGVTLKNTTLVAFESISYAGVELATHADIEDEDQTVYIPEIKTSALDKDSKTKNTFAGNNATVVDTVSYSNLIPGLTYKVSGYLVDKSTGKALLIDGKEVTASKEFTATAATGTVELEFAFDASTLENQTLVVFESLYYNTEIIADHKDVEDEAQTIYIPKVRTTAIDADTETKNALADEEVTIVDTVYYDNLIVGQEYTVKGNLVEKTMTEQTEPTIIASAETTFTATATSGTVDVVFVFNATGMDGKTLVGYEYLYTNNTLVGQHTDITDPTQTIYFPEIGTTALDNETEDHISLADETVTIIDTVAYKNLIPGTQYVVTGTLMDKETGEAIISDGEEVTSSTAFTPVTSSGTVEVIFTFDGSLLAGKTVVAFESVTVNDRLVAVHADIHDREQTVQIPEIKTTAVDSDSLIHNSMADDEITIIDTVEFKNLIPGREYTMVGTLMNKETGEPILVNGEEVTAATTFIPEMEDGTVDVTFVFDGTGLEGTTLVAFEDLLYRGVKVAVHADIEDEAQTVYVPEIHTNAVDSETEIHHSMSDEEITIIDTVSYSNLIPGTEYTITGTLMDQSTGEALMVEDAEVTSSVTFTPEEAEGTVDVVFTFYGAGLEGKTLVAFETLTYENVILAVHADIEDEEQSIYIPEIRTTAVDSDSLMHNSLADDDVLIIDTVSYTNLIPGTEYTVTGTLMDKETGEAILDQHNDPITASTTFTPEESDGTVDVRFAFNGENFAGKTLVAFETLSYNGITIAIHEDLEDEDQTIYMPEVRTTATNKADGTKNLLASGTVTILDKVEYKNLVVGETYTVSGKLVEKTTGDVVKVNGKEVTSSTTFTAETADGTIDMEFTFNGDGLGDKDLVVFESIALESNGVVIGVHEDINDDAQTVHMITPTPTTTTTTQTGDSGMAYWIAGTAILLMIAGSGAIVLVNRKRKAHNN